MIALAVFADHGWANPGNGVSEEREMSYPKRTTRSRYLTLAVVALLVGSAALWVMRARQRQEKEAPTPGPMLEQGFLDLETPAFSLRLVKSSQTLAALKPKGAGDFDFTPGDLLVERSQNGYFHLGDITFRLRAARSGAWQNYSSAAARTPVNVLPVSRGELAAADLSPTFP